MRGYLRYSIVRGYQGRGAVFTVVLPMRQG